MTNVIETETFGLTLVVRFARPAIRNPLSIEVLEILHAIVDNRNFEKLIFTGTADVFASGADLREIAKVSAEDAVEFALRTDLDEQNRSV